MIKFIPLKDCNNLSIEVGDKVRLLSVPNWLLEKIPEDEVKNLQSMVGEIFTVDEIDEYGGVWVEKFWDLGDGKNTSHSLCLKSEGMELITKKETTQHINAAESQGRARLEN